VKFPNGGNDAAQRRRSALSDIHLDEADPRKVQLDSQSTDRGKRASRPNKKLSPLM
jgi:hypothetical protein